MRIEKVNENQIKCTLSREDLASRHLRISELAYGSEKARELFQDMIQQAHFELGFDADNIPLMIEAIPVSGECLVLLVTKVEDPEELDTRFSNFTPTDSKSDSELSERESHLYADDILNYFEHLEELLEKMKPGLNVGESKSRDSSAKDTALPASDTKGVTTRVYVFHSFRRLQSVAAMLSPFYSGENTLYLDEDGSYYLVVKISDTPPEEFNKLCNILSEYGTTPHTSYASPAFFEEHLRLLIPDDAIQTLAAV